MFGIGPGVGVRTDRSGLRINLSPNRKREEGAGVATRFRISGDFEITLSYALLSSENPEKGFGAGMKVWLKVGDHPKQNITLAHFRRPKSDNQIVALVTTFDAENNKSLDTNSFDPAGTAGRMRLVRTGSTLKLLAADGESDEFKEVHHAEVGTEDVQAIRIQATSSGAPVSVSVRLSHLTVRADKLSIQGSPPPDSGSRWIWWAVGIGVLGGVAALLAWRRFANRRTT